uniref:Uncharacterized protein n=1 Tax=Vespula pensylvanica TaxID=30213 RepID=A0A834PD66_VESPE|nr:hypothetical protein H0235_004138 [Vespula pensylvanica]
MEEEEEEEEEERRRSLYLVRPAKHQRLPAPLGSTTRTISQIESLPRYSYSLNQSLFHKLETMKEKRKKKKRWWGGGGGGALVVIAAVVVVDGEWEDVRGRGCTGENNPREYASAET